MIFWPCVLKLDGDDELIYLKSNLAFIDECEELILTPLDHLIDSIGFTYLISETLQLVKSNQKLSVDDVTELIRASEFKKAELCLTKIHFLRISDAISAINH